LLKILQQRQAKAVKSEVLKTHCRVLKLADKPSGLEGGGNGIKSSLFGDLTAPWRFEPSLYSKLRWKILVFFEITTL